MKKMKERPILFNGDMVRAILEGRKTQTRRVIKPQPEDMTTQVIHLSDGIRFATEDKPIKCPFGKPGDELWVRENWRTAACFDKHSATEMSNQAKEAGFIRPPYGPLWYPSDGSYSVWGDSDLVPIEENGFGGPGRLRPSIHMPRWASRLQLRIKDVRVERVQDITESDARTEGCVKSNLSMSVGIEGDSTYRENFEKLWNSINEKRGFGWDVNPWVWVVDFERINQG